MLALLGSLLGFTGVVGLVGWVTSTPGHTGPGMPHFDGRKFHNLEPTRRAPSEVMRGIATWTRGAWNLGPVPAAERPPERVQNGIRVTMVGHATVLVQMDGVNLLTDPVWSVAAGPRGWMGPRRRRPPALPLDALPPIDLVLLSHNHYDHLDVPTLVALHQKHRCTVVTPLGNAAYLRRFGIDAVELDWWGSSLQRGLAVTCVPAQHFSGRGLFDRDHSLWGGFVVEGPAGRVYFAGDTGWGSHFAEIGERCGPPDVALLPIGAFRPRAIMRPVHTDPEEAVRAHRALGAVRSVPIHFGTFALGADGPDEALTGLAAARVQHGVAEEAFAELAHGASLVVRVIDRECDPARSSLPS